MALSQVLQALAMSGNPRRTAPYADPMATDAGPRLPGAAPMGGVTGPASPGVPDDLAALFSSMLAPTAPPAPDYRGQATAARERQQAALREASGMVDPAPRSVAFRTPDAFAGVLALLAGNQGGAFASSYLGGKLDKAANDTQRDAYAAQARRQGLAMQAQAYGQEAADYMGAADKADTLRSLEGRATDKNQTTLKTAEIKALYGLKGKLLSLEDAAAGRFQRSRDANFKAGLDELMKLPPGKARESFAAGLIEQYPASFGAWTAGGLVGVGELTTKEENERAGAELKTLQKRKVLADIGYVGARTGLLEKLEPGQLEKQAAEIRKINADASAAVDRHHVDQARAAEITTRTGLLEPSFRLKAADSMARAARYHAEAMQDDPRAVGSAVSAYKSMAYVGKTQEDAILKRNANKNPAPGTVDYDAWQNALKLKQAGNDGLLDIEGRIKRAHVNPTTAGRNPSVGRILSGPIEYGGAHPNGMVSTKAGRFPVSQVIREANEAISRGVSRAAVVAQLKAAGVTVKGQ